MLRYYLDEHMPNAIAEQLRAIGIDVLTTREAGNAGIQFPDESQLSFATRGGYVLVTEDQDFIQLAGQSTDHAGIVFFPIKFSLGNCITYLELLAQTTEPEEIAGQLVYGRW